MAYLTSGKKKLLGSNTEGNGDTSLSFWQPNTEYKVNDSCLYKNTDYYSLYICTADHTSADTFVSAYWETIDGTEFEGYTEDELLAMLNLSQDELQNLQNLLQDNVISTTSTFSSSKIYAELLTLKEELDKVFQNVDNGKDLIASAITDKGINTSKDDTFETMANNISSIIQSGNMNVIHNTMENLGYDYTDLSGLNIDDTARLISKCFILKQASENVSNIMSATAGVNFNNFLIDGKLQDFGNVINPVYTKETINQTKNTVNNVFVSDDISVELINVYMEGV